MCECNVERILNEVSDMIRYNLFLLLNCNDSFSYIRDYCEKNPNLKVIPYWDLVKFMEDSISELIDYPLWFDFRDLD